jgi:hypothetical protein
VISTAKQLVPDIVKGLKMKERLLEMKVARALSTYSSRSCDLRQRVLFPRCSQGLRPETPLDAVEQLR